MQLSEKQLKIITETASREAVKAHQAYLEEQEKVKHDRRLRNIKLLLKNYRALVLHCQKREDDLLKFEETSILDLDLDEINLESIESIKQSKKKSIAMVHFIKGKIEAYRHNCSQNELKYFRVLEKKYITPKKYTVQEIAKIENIDRATVHRYLNKAMTDLPVIFFGIDAIKFEK
ncbi:hypothetical protein ACS127_17305 [Amphibacillus sp. Q70]|uniref:hypothetical protein n=1 Tax=Amphibacillus sp. Q70 TaxID=3453416 RepID=UPI003F84D96A